MSTLEVGSGCKVEQNSYQNFNPLLEDNILDKVFAYILWPWTVFPPPRNHFLPSIETVKNIRLVCKLWRDRITPKFRQARYPVRFGEYYYKSLPESTDINLAHFMNVMAQSRMLPVQRYQLNTSIFEKYNEKRLTRFVKVFLPRATHLEIKIENFTLLYSACSSISSLNLTKLKSLHIFCGQTGELPAEVGDPYGFRQRHDISHFLDLLLTSAEDLQDFRFDLSYTCLIKKESHKMISELCKRLPKTLTKFELNAPSIDDTFVEILYRKELKLDEFILHKFDFTDFKEEVRGFFLQQSPTLRRLTVHLQPNIWQLFNEVLPRMKEILHLKVEKDEGEITSPIAPIPDIFPKLTVLNLGEIQGREMLDVCKRMLGCFINSSSVTELILPNYVAVTSVTEMVKVAANSFPNVRKLALSINVDIGNCLQEVYKSFSELTELKLTIWDLSEEPRSGDAILGAITEADCKNIVGISNLASINLKNLQRGSSMLSMTKLKKLVLGDCDNTAFTDFSAHFIFLEMANLEELHLVGSKKLKISSKYATCLRKKLKVLDATF